MFILFLTVAAPGAAPPAAASPEQRALAYLAREVPRWSRENRCYSCHNNGNGARALFAATRLGLSVPPGALADTTSWLARPGGWDRNGGDGPFSDRKLARLNFAASLAEAHSAGLIKDRKALADAARLVAEAQGEDGAWRVVGDGTLGSPTTLGTPLATALARATLLRLDARGQAKAIARADLWARKARVVSVQDAAAVLLVLGKADDAPARGQRRRSLEQLRKGRSRDGGWGPYVNSPPEVFDTAVVVLALAAQEQSPEVRAALTAGRRYLLATQEEDGSWTETTRPSGADSYAERLSTTGWATLALLSARGTAP
jgi:hypothetical protein